jgi:hypothetical protein
MTNQAAHQTRLERILGAPLAEDAVRQWPQSGERIDGRARIGEVEAHFVGLRLGVGRRHALGDTIVVEWSTDYGDGRVYRNVSIAELRDGKAIRVTDYWVRRSRRHRGGRRWRRPWTCHATASGRPPTPSRATDTTARRLWLRQGVGGTPSGRCGRPSWTPPWPTRSSECLRTPRLPQIHPVGPPAPAITAPARICTRLGT